MKDKKKELCLFEVFARVTELPLDKTTEEKSAEELWNNVSREGVTVGEMLSSVKQKDIYIF